MSPKSSKPRKSKNLSPAQLARRAAIVDARGSTKRRRWAVAAAVLIGVFVLGIVVQLSVNNDKDTTDVAADGSTSTSVAKTAATTATTASSTTSTEGTTNLMPTQCPAADGSSPQTRKFSGEPPMCIDPARTYTATMTTTKGTLTIVLDPRAAPKTVNNFVVLARYHYFDGVSFHRIIPGFVIQGGDPDGTGRGGPGYKFADELPQAGRYELGSLAMANSGPNTNGSQFFIISGPQGMSLPPSYSLFGKVVGGMEVVAALDAIGSPGAGTPKEPVGMVSVTIAES